MTTLDRALMKAYRQRAGAPHAHFGRGNAAPTEPESSANQVAPALVAGAPGSVAHEIAPALVAGPPPLAAPAADAPARLPDSSPATPALLAGPPPLPAPTPVLPALELEGFDWPPLLPSLREALADDWHSLVEQIFNDARTLLVTGCRRGEGRTSVALLMASMLAADGTRVGLVDADFAKPGLAARLGVSAATSWTNAIGQGLPAAEAMIESLADRLILLPLREPAESPSVDAETVRAAMAALRAQCELVCIDAGPQLDAGDAALTALLGAGVDSALVVHDARHSRLQQSLAIGRRLAQAGIARWAIIENFARGSHV
ncbi:MAG TPA: hypothetical protein VFW87_12530 [Pirellulales bacterium]|nr:hypothetical protein [Pirellulales bacterium]